MSKEAEDLDKYQLSELEAKLLYFLRHGNASIKELGKIDSRYVGALGKLKSKGLVVIEKEQVPRKRKVVKIKDDLRL